MKKACEIRDDVSKRAEKSDGDYVTSTHPPRDAHARPHLFFNHVVLRKACTRNAFSLPDTECTHKIHGEPQQFENCSGCGKYSYKRVLCITRIHLLVGGVCIELSHRALTFR